RPVGRQGLAVLDAHRRRGRRGLQLGAVLDAGRLRDGAVLGVDRVLLLVRALLPLGVVAVDQEHVLHRNLLVGCGRLYDERTSPESTIACATEPGRSSHGKWPTPSRTTSRAFGSSETVASPA